MQNTTEAGAAPTTQLFQIRHRWTNAVLFEGQFESLKLCVIAAVAASSDLRDSDLRGSDLRGSDLTPIRDDLWAVLSAAPAEATGLRDALAAGRVDGSTYEGECACLVGTIANVRGENYASLGALKPNSARPIERFFLGIRKGDTPEASQFSALALEWTEQWLAAMRAAFGSKAGA